MLCAVYIESDKRNFTFYGSFLPVFQLIICAVLLFGLYAFFLYYLLLLFSFGTLVLVDGSGVSASVSLLIKFIYMVLVLGLFSIHHELSIVDIIKYTKCKNAKMTPST